MIINSAKIFVNLYPRHKDLNLTTPEILWIPGPRSVNQRSSSGTLIHSGDVDLYRPLIYYGVLILLEPGAMSDNATVFF